MKHLQELYPESRKAKKRQELDKLATSYVQALYGYLSCLDLANKEGVGIADDILSLASIIHQTQYKISGELATTKKQEELQRAGEEIPELTEAQRDEMVALIKQYGISVMKDESDELFYILHKSLQGRAMALNEVEVYEIAQDIAAKLTAA